MLADDQLTLTLSLSRMAGEGTLWKQPVLAAPSPAQRERVGVRVCLSHLRFLVLAANRGVAKATSGGAARFRPIDPMPSGERVRRGG